MNCAWSVWHRWISNPSGDAGGGRSTGGSRGPLGESHAPHGDGSAGLPDRWRGTATVFADTGELMGEVGPDPARDVANRFMDVAPERVRYETLLTQSDQWTISQRRLLPFHKLSIGDEARTQLYVSPESGEVTLLTTRVRRPAISWNSCPR